MDRETMKNMLKLIYNECEGDKSMMESIWDEIDEEHLIGCGDKQTPATQYGPCAPAQQLNPKIVQIMESYKVDYKEAQDIYLSQLDEARKKWYTQIGKSAY